MSEACRSNPALLDQPLVALFSSSRCLGDVILQAYDAPQALRDAGVPLIGDVTSSIANRRRTTRGQVNYAPRNHFNSSTHPPIDHPHPTTQNPRNPSHPHRQQPTQPFLVSQY